jgi:hypothetical protein
MLESRVYTSVTDIAKAAAIGKSYVSRILRLALLAPDIVETILEGRAIHVPMLATLERPPPASWEEQRDRIGSPGCRERCPSSRAAKSSRSRVDPSMGLAL